LTILGLVAMPETRDEDLERGVEIAT